MSDWITSDERHKRMQSPAYQSPSQQHHLLRQPRMLQQHVRPSLSACVDIDGEQQGARQISGACLQYSGHPQRGVAAVGAQFQHTQSRRCGQGR